MLYLAIALSFAVMTCITIVVPLLRNHKRELFWNSIRYVFICTVIFPAAAFLYLADIDLYVDTVNRAIVKNG